MQNPFQELDERLVKIETLLVKVLNTTTKKEEKEENLTVKETASFLKVSEQSVHNYIKKGYIKAQKVGRVLLIPRKDLEQSLSEVKSLKYRRD